MTALCVIFALGAVLTAEFASGMAMVSGSDGFAKVNLGLWHGIAHIAGRRQVFRLEWCDASSPSFDGPYCAQLQVCRVAACAGVCLLVAVSVLLALLATNAVRTRFEAPLTKIVAGTFAMAALCFGTCLGVWVALVVSLSTKEEDSKARLSIGMSWLAEGGAFILAFLLAIKMLQTATRIEGEARIATDMNKRARNGTQTSYPNKPEKPRSRPSHDAGDLEA